MFTKHNHVLASYLLARARPPGYSVETQTARELAGLDANWEDEGYIAAGEVRMCVEEVGHGEDITTEDVL